MSTMNVSLPEELKAYVDDQVRNQGFGTTSEYVRELIRRDRDRARLRALLVDGLESSATVAADEVYFDELRARVSEQSS
jgi:antitoxin ParD1/3/4